jgi:hypothetical protein
VLTKEQRVQIVAWIRKGAPLKQGVRLYAELPNKPRLLAALDRNAKQFEDQLKLEMCGMLGITLARFNQIIKEHGTKQPQQPRIEENGKKTGIEKANTPKRSFRTEFPFLSRANCPPELKALAADKITAWENYTAAHEKLFDCNSLDQCYETAFDVVENYLENRLIYEELEYYGKNGSILGKHRIFDQYKKYQRLRGYNVIELVKLHEKTLPHRIWRIESVIKKGDKPHLAGEWQKRLEEAQAELAEVKRLLNINE